MITINSVFDRKLAIRIYPIIFEAVPITDWWIARKNSLTSRVMMGRKALTFAIYYWTDWTGGRCCFIPARINWTNGSVSTLIKTETTNNGGGEKRGTMNNKTDNIAGARGRRLTYWWPVWVLFNKIIEFMVVRWDNLDNPFFRDAKSGFYSSWRVIKGEPADTFRVSSHHQRYDLIDQFISLSCYFEFPRTKFASAKSARDDAKTPFIKLCFFCCFFA